MFLFSRYHFFVTGLGSGWTFRCPDLLIVFCENYVFEESFFFLLGSVFTRIDPFRNGPQRE